MKKQKITALLVAIGLFLAASVSFYKIYANASEKADQHFVSGIVVDAAKQERLTKNDLITATHIDQMENVSKVDYQKKAFLKDLKPGVYSLYMTIVLNFNQTMEKKVTVNVIDGEGPVIEVKGQMEVEKGQNLDKEKYLSATDKVDGKIPSDKIQVKDLDTNKAGKQEIQLLATDSYGNETTKKATVEVKEPAQPEAKEESAAATASEAAPSETAATAESADPAPAEAAPVQEIPETAPQKTAAAEPVQAAAPTPTPAPAPAPQPTTNTITFGGTTVSYGQANGSGAAPGSGAATWMGNGSTTDGAPTHFIGHNPGDFSGVMNLGVGSQITVTDSHGNSRTYTVYEVMDVTDDGYNNHNLSDDVYPRMLYAGGERISLQTCITETVNRCVLAR